ncbi:MAG TPA: hypothetical protein VMT34_14690 [Aggregatilineales bacterium]|nr:hypothetical protein [Aggregatilineales bacterium]
MQRFVVMWWRRWHPEGDAVARRLNRLRALYAALPNAGLHTRRVADILRGAVAPSYYVYYDRLLRSERTSASLLKAGTRRTFPADDLLQYVRWLTEYAAHLIEQVQYSDQMPGMYARGSTEQAMVEEARARLFDRLTEAIALHESIPAHILSLMAASAGQDFRRLREALTDFKVRIEGMTEASLHLADDSAFLAAVYEAIQQEEPEPHDRLSDSGH